MALIKCPDCGKMVSDRAQSCPDCGFPIQEEVQRINDITNIEGDDKSGEYSNLTEKEVAKKLCEVISKKQFADINVFQSILKNRFADGCYAKIVEDSRDFSDDETERNQYVVKNIELILDYLDYPLDAMGIRNWFVNKADRKGKGFFQSDADSFDDFSKYYINCDVCEVIDLKHIMSRIIRSSGFIERCVISSKSRFAVILKKNVNDYNNLVELGEKFIDAYDSDVKVMSSSTFAYSINSGDTVKLFEEKYERTVVDYVEMEKQMLHAVAQQLKFTSNVKQPITSVSTKTVAGALLAGPAGALVGYAVGKDKDAKFERSRQYNEEIRREQEKGRQTLNNLKYGDKPTKNVMLTRSYLGIMTFAGTLPFYVDSYYRGQEGWNVIIGDIVKVEEDKCNEFALEKIPSLMKDQIEIRVQLAKLYFEKGIIFPETSFVSENISKLLQNPDVNALALEELKYIENIDFNNYSEEQCNENIIFLEDMKKTVFNDSVVRSKVEEKISYIKAILEKKVNEEHNEWCEKTYQKILKENIEEASEYQLKDIINQLEKLGDYKDSLELKRQCEDKIKEYEKRQLDYNAEIERARLENLKKSRKLQITAACTVMAIIVAYMVITRVVIPNKNYNDAVALMYSGDYTEAIAEFEALKGFKDSVGKINDCNMAIIEENYNKAVEYMKSKDYIAAHELLDSLQGYKDSEEIKNSIEDKYEYRLAKIAIADVGETVLFGGYNGNTEWIILDKEDGKVLLLNKYGVEKKSYNIKYTSVTWEKCTLRSWLNEAYLTSAFSPDDQTRIIESVVANNDNDKYKSDGGNNTTDKIFLLSIDEANKYITLNRKVQAALSYEGGACYLDSWWLRSPGFHNKDAAYVDKFYVSDSGCSVDRDNLEVLPVLWIDISDL